MVELENRLPFVESLAIPQKEKRERDVPKNRAIFVFNPLYLALDWSLAPALRQKPAPLLARCYLSFASLDEASPTRDQMHD